MYKENGLPIHISDALEELFHQLYSVVVKKESWSSLY